MEATGMPSLVAVNHPRYLSDTDYNPEKSESFDEYMSRNGPIVVKYEVPSNCSSVKVIHMYVPQVHRAHLKDLVDFVFDQHNKGLSFESFDESNLVVHDFAGSSSGHKFLHDIIQNFERKYNPFNYECKSLEDILDGLRDTRSFRDLGINYEFMIQNHFVLISHKMSVERIMEFFYNSKFMHEEEREKYNASLWEMETSRDWTARFRGNNKPQLGPAKDCFDYKPVVNEGVAYKGTGRKEVVNAEILRFCRNMGAHLHQHMPNHNKPQCGQKDIDLTIMALFETELLIFKNGISSYFIRAGQDKTSSGVTQDSLSSYGGDGRRSEASTPSSSTGQSSRPSCALS